MQGVSNSHWVSIYITGNDFKFSRIVGLVLGFRALNGHIAGLFCKG